MEFFFEGILNFFVSVIIFVVAVLGYLLIIGIPALAIAIAIGMGLLWLGSVRQGRINAQSKSEGGPYSQFKRNSPSDNHQGYQSSNNMIFSKKVLDKSMN